MQGALAFSDSAIEERGDTPYVWLARADVLLARKEPRADYCFEKALLLAPRNWFIVWLGARIRHYYEQFALALKLLQQALEWNAGHFLLWTRIRHGDNDTTGEGRRRIRPGWYGRARWFCR